MSPTFPILDLVGHTGYLLLIIGSWRITKRDSCGFLLRVAGSLSWAVVGWEMMMSSILLWSLAFAVVDSLGWWRWRSE